MWTHEKMAEKVSSKDPEIFSLNSLKTNKIIEIADKSYQT